MSDQELSFEIGDQIGPDPEESGYDAGGWLRGGCYIIPASTMNPMPQLTPEQVETFERIMRRGQVIEES